MNKLWFSLSSWLHLVIFADNHIILRLALPQMPSIKFNWASASIHLPLLINCSFPNLVFFNDCFSLSHKISWSFLTPVSRCCCFLFFFWKDLSFWICYIKVFCIIPEPASTLHINFFLSLWICFGWAAIVSFKLAMLVFIFVELSQLSPNYVLG